LGNSRGNYQLRRFTTSENIAKSFLGGATFLTRTVDSKQLSLHNKLENDVLTFQLQ